MLPESGRREMGREIVETEIEGLGRERVFARGEFFLPFLILFFFSTKNTFWVSPGMLGRKSDPASK
jgi:hypothetical protein